MFDRPVAIGLSPNTTSDDYILTLKTLLLPRQWKTGEASVQVTNWFKEYFRVETVVALNAGRSALVALLASLDLEAGSEVLVQAFTCVAVPNAVLWAGYKPVYVDIDQTQNLDVEDAEKKVTPKTRVLIVQHTFGIPANMEKIIAFCRKFELILIEDCAHALGARYKGKLIGTFGDAAFFSFGRDKIVSSVFGGIALVSQNSKIKSQKLIEFVDKLDCSSYFWIFQQLLHPLISAIVLPMYTIAHIGKGILWVAQKLRFLSFPVYDQEKIGKQPTIFPQKLPNALAILALHQLEKLERLNRKRREVAEYYFLNLKEQFHVPQKDSGAIYLRFNLITKRADEIRFQAKKQGMIFGNWYRHTIDPKGVDLAKIGYKLGSCPKAEKVALASLNLPTYPTLSQVQVKNIVALVKKYSDET